MIKAASVACSKDKKGPNIEMCRRSDVLFKADAIGRYSLLLPHKWLEWSVEEESLVIMFLV
jgi:hypothetical protein